MRALDRKLVRDLRLHRAQVVSIALLVACGAMTVIGMRSTLASIREARDGYYRSHRMGDVFVSMQRTPRSVLDAVARIPGVATVHPRLVAQAVLDVPRLAESATGLLVSIPSPRHPIPNDLHVVSGRWVAPDRNDEVLISIRFAEANGLAPGDSIAAIVNGRWERLRIAGVAMSPEFVYETSGAAFMVDERRFGILWMREDALAAATDMSGAFNDLAILLAPGASRAQVLAELDRLLAPYGSMGAIGREDQTSNQVLEDEFVQLSAIGRIFPLFFLGVAAFLLNTVLSRLVSTQRAEIGALKALGYSNMSIGGHFLAFALVAVALGGALGVAGGGWMGAAYTGVYADYFRFPSLEHRTQWSAAAIALAVCGGSALLGAWFAVRQATSLTPAEAFRPPAPARFRPLLLERLGLAARIGPGGRMILRNLERRPFRTAASMIGIALASAVLIAGLYPYDAIASLIDIQFRRAQREDIAIAFTKARPARSATELAHIAGVMQVESFRATSARLRARHHVRTVAITGIEEGSTMRRLVDARGASHSLPVDGLVMSATLGDRLGVRIGDTVEVQLLELGGVRRRVVVSGLLDESLGLGAYMNRRALNRLLHEGDVASGAFVRVRSGDERAVFLALRRLPLVAGASSRGALLEFFERTVADTLLISGALVVFAAIVIVVGVVYNGARIAISERGRELASLRVLGFTRREVSRLFLGEQGIVTLAGLPLGGIVGFAFAALLAHAFASDRHRFPATVEATTYAFAGGVVLVVAAAVAIATRRHVDRLDLIATLKTGE